MATASFLQRGRSKLCRCAFSIERGALDASGRQALCWTIVALAKVADDQTVARVVAALSRSLEQRTGTTEDSISHLHALVYQRGEALKDVVAIEALPDLLATFARWVDGSKRLGQLDRQLIEIIRQLRDAMRESPDPGLRQRIETHARESMEPLLEHPIDEVRTVARKWTLP